jgi:hypothetical protein
MYLVVALSAGGTGDGQNKYAFAFFLPLALMSPSFQLKFFSEIIANISPFAFNFIAWEQN